MREMEDRAGQENPRANPGGESRERMLKLVVLGAGNHSQGNHLPTLAHYVAQHPGEVELAALCDLRREHAELMAARYGFARVYTDLEEMLHRERPHGCIAVTPIPITAQIAAQVIQAGVPLCMEKPPGATVAEAREIVKLAARSGTRVMVSMNRRFDPALRKGLAWRGDRPLTYLRASIVRVNRGEPGFMTDTAIHPLDTMRAIAGDVKDCEVQAREVEGVHWFVVRPVFENGALGCLEVLPTAGSMVESYEIYGPGYRVFVRTGAYDAGDVRCWEEGRLVVEEEVAQGMPDFVRNGTYDETVEFIAALRENRVPHPSPAQVLQSVELCHRIVEGYRVGR